MITSQTITEYLSQLGNDISRSGGVTENMYDMLVGARNELQRRETELIDCMKCGRKRTRYKGVNI